MRFLWYAWRMMIEDFIINGKLDEAKIKTLCKTVPYKSEIIWGENNYRQTKYTFENGLVYAEDNEHVKLLFTTDERKARFRADGSLEWLQEPDDSGVCYREDGIARYRHVFADGAQVCFYEDGKSVQHWLPKKDGEWQALPQYLGKIFANQDIEIIKTIMPIFKRLKETEMPILSVRIDRGGFVNELNNFDESTLSEVPKGYYAAYQPFYLADEDIDKDMKTIGIKIYRRFEQAYVTWDDKLNKKVYRDDEGKIFLPKVKSSCATVTGTEITVNTCRYVFCKEDYLRMKEIEAQIEEATHGFHNEADRYNIKNRILLDLPMKDYSLFMDYDNEHNIKETIYHESKHIKNHLLCEHRQYASDYRKPSEKGDYFLQVENERTASLEPLAKAVESYLRKGNYKDFSVFLPEYSWAANMLRYKTKDEIKKICYPPVKLMNKLLKDWNKFFLDDYFEQFKTGCEIRAEQMLLTEADKRDKEFKKQRRLMYTFEVFNPYSGKKEMLDMSELLDTEILISEKAAEEIIKPCREQREKAQEKMAEMYHDNEGKILLANLAEAMRRAYTGFYLNETKETGAEHIMQNATMAIPVKRSAYNRLAHNLVSLGKFIQRKFKEDGEINVASLKRNTKEMAHSVFDSLKKICR